MEDANGEKVEVKKVRDGRTEVYRCLLMLMVVVHHICCHGPYATSRTAWGIYWLTLPAVDGFVALSGWYGMRFSWQKALRLWGMFAFYSVLLWGAWEVAFTLGVSSVRPVFRVTGGWFGGTYLGLLFCMPLVNAALEALAKEPRKLFGAWGLYALAILLGLRPLGGLSGLSVSGWGSHTFNTLLFVYVTAWMVRRFVADRVKSVAVAGVWVLAMGSVGAMVLLQAFYKLCHSGALPRCTANIHVAGYHFPGVWVAAIAALVLCARCPMPQGLQRLARFLGPSMLGIYLLHDTSLRKVLFCLPMEHLHACFPEVPLVFIFAAGVILCFTLSLMVDLARRAGLALILRHATPLIAWGKRCLRRK
ncbi:MAG: acyltransferase [Lentisphaeraceae bacterium]|nr:acyltransferase [Lentisphaeraceae bacterium]